MKSIRPILLNVLAVTALLSVAEIRSMTMPENFMRWNRDTQLGYIREQLPHMRYSINPEDLQVPINLDCVDKHFKQGVFNRTLNELRNKRISETIEEAEKQAKNDIVFFIPTNIEDSVGRVAGIETARAGLQFLDELNAHRAMQGVSDAAKYACSWEYKYFKPLREKAFSTLQSAKNFLNNNKKAVIGTAAVLAVAGIGAYLYNNGYFNFGTKNTNKK